jgi:hypothetical protein
MAPGKQHVTQKPHPQPKQRKNKPKEKKEKKTVIYIEPKPQVTGPNAACLLEFATIRAQPFMKVDSMPCNPIYDEGYSTKRMMYQRVTFAAGTAGNGYFVFNPRIGVLPTGGDQCYMTTASFTGAGIETATLPVGAIGTSPTFPYNTIAAPIPAGWKLVSMGLRVRPTGKYLDTAGMIYKIATPQNRLINFLTPPQLFSAVHYPWMPIKHGACYQVNFVTKDEGIDDQYGALANNTGNNWSHGFYISGATPSYSFTAEVIQYWEYSFNADTPSDATPTPSIQQAKDLNSKITDETLGNRDFSESSVGRALKKVGDAAIDGAGGLAADYVAGWFQRAGYSNPHWLPLKPPPRRHVRVEEVF